MPCWGLGLGDGAEEEEEDDVWVCEGKMDMKVLEGGFGVCWSVAQLLFYFTKLPQTLLFISLALPGYLCRIFAEYRVYATATS